MTNNPIMQDEAAARMQAYMQGKAAEATDKCPYTDKELARAWQDGKYDAQENKR